MLIKNGFASDAYVERKAYFVKRRVKKVAGVGGFEPPNAGALPKLFTRYNIFSSSFLFLSNL